MQGASRPSPGGFPRGTTILITIVIFGFIGIVSQSRFGGHPSASAPKRGARFPPTEEDGGAPLGQSDASRARLAAEATERAVTSANRLQQRIQELDRVTQSKPVMPQVSLRSENAQLMSELERQAAEAGEEAAEADAEHVIEAAFRREARERKHRREADEEDSRHDEAVWEKVAQRVARMKELDHLRKRCHKHDAESCMQLRASGGDRDGDGDEEGEGEGVGDSGGKGGGHAHGEEGVVDASPLAEAAGDPGGGEALEWGSGGGDEEPAAGGGEGSDDGRDDHSSLDDGGNHADMLEAVDASIVDHHPLVAMGIPHEVKMSAHSPPPSPPPVETFSSLHEEDARKEHAEELAIHEYIKSHDEPGAGESDEGGGGGGGEEAALSPPPVNDAHPVCPYAPEVWQPLNHFRKNRSQPVKPRHGPRHPPPPAAEKGTTIFKVFSEEDADRAKHMAERGRTEPVITKKRAGFHHALHESDQETQLAWGNKERRPHRRPLSDDEARLPWGVPPAGGGDKEEGGAAAPRRLAEFSKAGAGGKRGASCELNAPMKSRQACYERRALARCKLEEDEGKSVRMAPEGSEFPLLPLTGPERTLSRCIEDPKQCTATRTQLRAMAVKLKGIQMLGRTRPKCILQNRIGGCSELSENAESGLLMGGCGQRGAGPKKGCDDKGMYDDIPLPREDLDQRYGTCAVVGNNMNLFRTQNGASIDAHDAVIRFNNEAARMVDVLKHKGMTLAKMSRYVGTKTTFRLLNRKYTNQMLDEEVEEHDLSDADFVVFWNYYSVAYLKHLNGTYPGVHMYLQAPDLINWMLAIFSQLRRDMVYLGLKPGDCYRSMSSGVHGVLQALLMCGKVDMYGFSVSMENFAAGFNHGKPSESHGWEFETQLWRLLYYAGAIDVCNV